MSVAETLRAQELLALAERARTRGLSSLSDDELLRFFAEHRWAVGRLAEPEGSVELRSLLNAAVLRGHGVLHRRPTAKRARTGAALRRVRGALGLALLAFLGSAVTTFIVLTLDPVLALAVVPRDMLAHIDDNAWSSRGGLGADLGMTLFYWGNNLRASFLALSLGVLGGVPALFVLAYNGALLGGIAAVSVERGVLDRLLGWVLPHGVPELSALLLCGAIGWSLGVSWLRPAARTRQAVLAARARELLPLMLVAAVLVVCAAPLEGFVAPLALPRWLDASIALTWCVVLAALTRYAVAHTPPPRAAP